MTTRRNTLRALARVLPALLLPAAMARAGDAVVIGDMQNYTRGPWTAFNNPFSKGALVQGRDYTQSTSINPGAFPNKTTMTFNWPDKPDRAMSILGFNQICYGDYYNTVPAAPIVPRRLRDIADLTVTHDLDFAFDENANTVIYDFFLTPRPRDDAHHLFEIEVLLHVPRFARHYVGTLDEVGTVEVSGISWHVVIDRKPAAPDVIFVPAGDADLPRGSLDLKAMLAYLTTRGILTGAEYYNGHAFGIEVGKRSGSLLVREMRVTYR